MPISTKLPPALELYNTTMIDHLREDLPEKWCIGVRDSHVYAYASIAFVPMHLWETGRHVGRMVDGVRSGLHELVHQATTKARPAIAEGVHATIIADLRAAGFNDAADFVEEKLQAQKVLRGFKRGRSRTLTRT